MAASTMIRSTAPLLVLLFLGLASLGAAFLLPPLPLPQRPPLTNPRTRTGSSGSLWMAAAGSSSSGSVGGRAASSSSSSTASAKVC